MLYLCLDGIIATPIPKGTIAVHKVHKQLGHHLIFFLAESSKANFLKTLKIETINNHCQIG